MRDLVTAEINEISGGASLGLVDSLLGGVVGVFVGAADGLYSGAKRGAGWSSENNTNGPVQKSDPLTGLVNGLGAFCGAVLGGVAGAVGGAVGGLGAGVADGMQEVTKLNNIFNDYLNPSVVA